jgi:hypothetical protein
VSSLKAAKRTFYRAPVAAEPRVFAYVTALEAEVAASHAALALVVMDRNVGALDNATQQAVSDAYRATLPTPTKGEDDA